MTGFSPVKPRRPGTLHQALSRAVDQVAGPQAAGDLIERTRSWVYAACDPDAPPEKAARLSYAEARTLTRAGASALAEDLALLAGGVFLPPAPDAAPCAVSAALAEFSADSGAAVAGMVRALADGLLDRREASRTLGEIDRTLRALCALRAVTAAAAEAPAR